MKEFDELKKIIDTLRSPEGCPWDLKQTHDSLLQYLYEETNEVGEAIIRKDIPNLKEELGDLLLQIMLHARIAEEKGDFTLNQVIETLNQKLIRRHPHVFSNTDVADADEVVKNWDVIKQKEKQGKTHPSIFDQIQGNYSPLINGYNLQKAASKAGFDWPDYQGVLDKIDEELDELKEAIDTKEKSEIEHELGDIFFALINLARFLKVDTQTAVNKANARFIERFKYIENRIDELHKSFNDFTLAELEAFWQEAKAALKKAKSGA